jgi:hypothetical protein
MCEVASYMHSETAVGPLDGNLCLSIKKNSFVLPKDTGEGNGAYLQRKVFEHNERHPSGGLKWKDEAELKRQRGVAWDLIKSVGSNILEGKDLVNTSLPIYLFEPRSFLERLTDIFAYAPCFLRKAAHVNDPAERMKYVVAFAITGLHLLTTNKKPFNPILGETYQAKFFDGTEVACEQTTHHPPACNWQMVPPDKSFHYWGNGIWSASCRGNTIKGYQKGPHNVEFPDGCQISWSLPDILLKGIMWGERVMEYLGVMTFVDHSNHLQCDIEFNPEGKGFFRSMFGKAKQPSDYFRGEIYRTTSKKKSEKDVVYELEGSWLEYLDVGGERLWDIKMVPSGVIPHSDPLPSDSRFREDLMALLNNEDVERAKECKIMLEERQRHDERVRKEGRTKRKKHHKK